MKQIFIKRLTFIKYLFESGKNQSYQPEPMNGLSVLSFHDAVELFLQLCLEKLNISKRGIRLMEYFDIIDNKLRQKGTRLSQKESIRRLNDARGNMKHRGIIPSKLDIESFRATTWAFFVDNCPLIFDINFDDISLIILVSFKQSKEYLEKAQSSFEKGQIEDCLTNLALSFEYLMINFEDDIRKKLKHKSKLLFLERYSSLYDLTLLHPLAPNATYFQELTETIGNMKLAMKSIIFGIDYKKLMKFKIITPIVKHIANGSHKFFIEQDTLSKDEFDFCLNFIVESALRLQEFSSEIH